MRVRLAPKDDSYFPLFAESADNLVRAADTLAEFVTAAADRERWPAGSASSSTQATP